MPEIQRLLDRIEENAIVLPEFQREFVWGKDQSKELMKSLYRGFPIGSILLWETENPPEIKNDAIAKDVHKLFKVLLDGQQRLTVLYLLIKGEVPPYYTKEDLLKDPRSLYFNLRSGDFHFENKPVREDPEWVKVTEIFKKDLGGTDVVRSMSDDQIKKIGADKFDLADLYDKQLKKIHRILNKNISVESLPKTADIHEAIDLFDKINSQGTHLSDAELALAHMGAQWPHVRRRLKEKQKSLKERGYSFKLNFYVKAMIAVVTESMTYEKIYNVPKDKLKESWQKLANKNGVFDYLFDLLEHEGQMPDSSYITTRDSLIPFLTYIYKKDCRLTDEEKNSFLQWFYYALMWRRYGGSADTTIESDLSLLNSSNPTPKLIDEIKSDRGRLEIQAADLEMSTKRSKHYYNMVRVVIRANDPIDWKTGQPIKGSFDLESHHIFPKSQLYKTYDGKKSNHRKLVNEISNRAFITPSSNKELGDKLPQNYLPKILKRNPTALKKQFIPENKDLWNHDYYEEFLKRRRELLANAINTYIKNVVKAEIKEDESPTIEDLISLAENEQVELKETLLWDIYQNQPNKDLKAEIAKEVCAFANKNGGNIIIGVSDNKEIMGIDRDLKNLKKGLDDFELQLNQELRKRLGKVFASVYTDLEFSFIEGKQLAIITIEQSPDPVYFETGNGKEFLVRQGSSSISLDVEEARQYQDQNF